MIKEQRERQDGSFLALRRVRRNKPMRLVMSGKEVQKFFRRKKDSLKKIMSGLKLTQGQRGGTLFLNMLITIPKFKKMGFTKLFFVMIILIFKNHNRSSD